MPKRTSPLYHSRWFEEEDTGREWLERVLPKYRRDYPECTFDVQLAYKKFPYENFKKWHATIRKIDNEENL